ncbi:MAG TPA: carboxymuconolactone decarboxylase family protein [Polyangiaceae bacterium]|jgi:uncharacterized peroxidase-related enzyme
MKSAIAPLDLAAATGKTKELLDGVKKGLGVVPNLFRVAARSPAALEAMVSAFGAISHGTLNAKTREAIALATAQADGCNYCLSAHTYLGKHAGLSEADVAAAREGGGADPKVAAAARFARRLVETRGHVGEEERARVIEAGFEEGQVIEIIANVAWSVFTNFVNETAGTEIDFEPVVRA